jgi:peptidoglycan/LPS O-acetylase OafA/YrhL
MNKTIVGNSVTHGGNRKSASHISELDGLRGMAILLVVLYHYLSWTHGTRMPWLKRIFSTGWSGVDLFFVLSGFLIGGILLDTRESPRYFKTFYARRALRILPLYYVWIAVYFVIAAFVGNPEGWRSVPAYVLFVQNLSKGHHLLLGSIWLGHLWSLCVEEQFYLVIPLAILFLARRKLLAFLCLAIVVAPVLRVLLHRYLPSHPAAQYTLTICRVDALAMGVLVAIAWRNEEWKTKLRERQSFIIAAVFLLLVAFALLTIWQPSQYSLTMTWGLSMLDALFTGVLILTLLAPSGTWGKICRWPFLIELGRVSFCLYVIHEIVNLMFHEVLFHAEPRADTWQTIGVTLLAALFAYGVARLSWKFLESPMMRRRHAFTY